MSRHHMHCQYCGAELPDNLLLKPDEIEAERHAWERSEKQRQARQAEADAEEKARRASIDSTYG
jgi:hypothetical protein